MHSEDAVNDKFELSLPVSSAIHRRPCPSRKISVAEDMIKHRPIIPRYLQFEDNKYNIQEKALNVGVLDWGQLQKWTEHEKPVANNRFNDSPSNSIPSFLFSSFNSSACSSRGSPSTERKQSSSLGGQQPSKSSSTLNSGSLLDNDQRKGSRKDSSKLIIKSQAADIGSSPSALTGTESFALLHRKANTMTVKLDELEKLEIRGEKERVRSHVYEDGHRPKQSRTKHLEEIIARSISSFDSSSLDRPRVMNSSCFTGTSSLPHLSVPSSSTHREEPCETKEIACFERGEQHPPIFLPRVDLKGINGCPSKSISDNSNEAVVRSSSREKRSPMRQFFDQPRTSASSVNYISDNSDAVSGSSSRGRHRTVKQMIDPPLNLSNSDVSVSRSSSRGRRSPLRQMFELPRKSSSSINSSQHQLQESCVAIDHPTSIQNPSSDPNNLPSTREALLKLSWKNGLPLLMFSSSDDSILVAMMHKRSNSEMNIYDCVYEIHAAMAVEVKKKNAAWLSQGMKGRKPEFSCKFVAELIVSTSEQVSFDLSHRSFIRELVLVGDELVPSNREDIMNLSNSELAAIVVETSQKNSPPRCGGLCVPQIVAILPSDVHGLSNTKEPSKLIKRWKSGGSCDCGGWDEGCALTILTNHSLQMNNSKSVEGCGAVDGTSCGFALFTQSDARKGKHSFSMVAFKEDMFTVEFKASIHLLQAFAISIALLHDRSPGDGGMRNHLADIDNFKDFSFDSYPSISY